MTPYEQALFDLTRFDEEEEALRDISPVEGALGRNASDYHNMWSLFTQIVNRASAMNQDPTAFLDTRDRYDPKMLGAWTKMIATARGILEGLNKMRNSDKMTNFILEKHTRDLTAGVAIDLSIRLRDVITALEGKVGVESEIDALKKLLNRGLPEIFGKHVVATLASSREEFGLPN